ncbi:Hypothetical protein HVR_LOCUS1172 [uncultured virus]|nr:Hypothetical protein HVR_LOCUS1172 [uncultured virus]
MLAWVSSLWLSGSFTGPARNAPNNGIDIKKLFDQRPTQVITVSEEVVKTTLKGLRKTVTNAVPPLSNKPPLMKEFEDVFSTGYKDFFIRQKEARAQAKQASLTKEILNQDTCTSVANLENKEESDAISGENNVPYTNEEIAAELTEFELN